MGIYDRDYYQGESTPAGIQLGNQWSMVGKLIAINAVVWIINLFTKEMDHSLNSLLAASPASLSEPWKIWQLVTYSFAHDDEVVTHIIFNMFGLFVFGRDVETLYGPKEFLRFYLVTAFLGGLLYAVRGMWMIDAAAWERYSVIGASGAVAGVTLLFCIHFPKRIILLMFVLPVPAWVLGAMYIVMNIWGVVGAPGDLVAYDVHLVGVAFAIIYYKLGLNLGQLTPNFHASRRWLKPKPKLKIHEPTVDDPYESLDAEADSLLAKVKRDGVTSLSDKERKVLEDYSRRMRQKHS